MPDVTIPYWIFLLATLITGTAVFIVGFTFGGIMLLGLRFVRGFLREK